MLSIMSYALPTGWRSLVLVEVPDAERPFSVLDIPLDNPLEADDCHVVGHALDDYFHAREAAHRHYRASKRLGRPATV